MIQTETAALVALLALRKSLVSRKPNRFRIDAILRDLEAQAYRGIMALRGRARLVGIADVASTFGATGQISLAARIEDVERARRYSSNLVKLAEKRIETPGGLAAIDSRLATIAVTENAQAFNSQRQQVVSDLVERYGIGIAEVWDATLDKRTCDECLRLDGSESVKGRGFPGGQIPGAVHPNCRCTSHFVRIH
jgi:hypothetical protein